MHVMAKFEMIDVYSGEEYIVEKLIDNCLDCPHHLRGIDCTDQNKTFCYKKTVVCELADDREITVSCHPNNLRKECRAPEWCPLVEGR